MAQTVYANPASDLALRDAVALLRQPRAFRRMFLATRPQTDAPLFHAWRP